MSESEYIVKNEELNDLPISNTPDSIFLNMGDLYVGAETKYDFNNLEDISWCSNSNGLCDIEYIRKDLVKKEIKNLITHQKELAKQLEKLEIPYEFRADGVIKLIG